MTTTAAPQDEFCYILRSCSKRMVDNVQCTLGRNNFLDVEYFVPSLESCKLKCQVCHHEIMQQFPALLKLWCITCRKPPTADITGGIPSRTASTLSFATSTNSAQLKIPSRRLVAQLMDKRNF